PFRTGGGAPTRNISEKPEPPVGAPAPGANASRRRSCRQTRFAPGRCSYTKHIGEARAHRRSTRPGCECLPAAAELPANPFRTEGGAPTQNISEKPEPAVGAPAPGANASRRRSGRKPVSHRGRCSYTEHIGEARTHRRSTRPGCECQPAAAELPATRFAPGAVLLRGYGPGTWGAAGGEGLPHDAAPANPVYLAAL